MSTFIDSTTADRTTDRDGPPAADRTAADGTTAATDPGMDVADQIIHLVRSWTFLKAKMTSTVDPELSSLFLIGRLVKNGPTRAKDLAEATCADQSTVSRQVAALVKAGLVERQADPDDGRASILVPTALGVERMNKHFANRGRALAPLLADWSDHERNQFVDLLGRFNANLDSRRDEIARLMVHGHAEAAGFLPATRAAVHSDAQHQPQSHPEHVHPHASSERSN